MKVKNLMVCMLGMLLRFLRFHPSLGRDLSIANDYKMTYSQVGRRLVRKIYFLISCRKANNRS